MSFALYTSVYEHLVINHKDIQTSIKYKCEKCRFQTSVEASFENHKQTHLVDSRSATRFWLTRYTNRWWQVFNCKLGQRKSQSFVVGSVLRKVLKTMCFYRFRRRTQGITLENQPTARFVDRKWGRSLTCSCTLGECIENEISKTMKENKLINVLSHCTAVSAGLC